MRTGAVEHGVGMGCAARKSQKPALEIGGWAGGAQVPCFCLQVCADNGEVWGGYGIPLASRTTTRHSVSTLRSQRRETQGPSCLLAGHTVRVLVLSAQAGILH